MASVLPESTRLDVGRSPAHLRTFPAVNRRGRKRSAKAIYDRVVQNHHTTLNIAAKKTTTPITIERFTFVVRLCTFTSGRPLLSFSMDMAWVRWTLALSVSADRWQRTAAARRVPAVGLLWTRWRRQAAQVKTLLVFKAIGRPARSQKSDHPAANQGGNSQEHDDDDRNSTHGYNLRQSHRGPLAFNRVLLREASPAPARQKAGRTPRLPPPHATFIGTRPAPALAGCVEQGAT